MIRILSSFGAVGALLLLAAPGCTGGFGSDPSALRFKVALSATADRGTVAVPKVIAVDPPDAYTFSVEALGLDGKRDTTFDGWLRISAKPGNIVGVTGESVDGRNIKLVNGFLDGITASVSQAYGETRLVVDDLGYTPVDPQRDPPPECADGKDNDGDGDIDFPADFECAFANDDTETGGTYASGASEAIYYHLPRVAEVRGYQNGGANTPFKAQAVSLDTGYRESTRDYDFTMVVTRISSDGFYVADLEDDRAEADRTGFDGLFAFNFSSPSDLGYCDRLRRLSGTATEFFGSIQIGFPTWSATAWDPATEPCLIPDPVWLKTDDVSDNVKTSTSTGTTPELTKLRYTHSLVRVMSGDYTDKTGATRRSTVRVTKFLGPDFPTTNPNGTFVLSENATNCDFNGDATIDFTTDPEKSCAAACDANPECTEYSNFVSRANFNFVVEDQLLVNGQPAPGVAATTGKIQGNGSTSPTFSATAVRGQPVKSFSGTLGYFSGGSQFTIEARCDDDIVMDLTKDPVPSNTACISRNTSTVDPTN